MYNFPYQPIIHKLCLGICSYPGWLLSLFAFFVLFCSFLFCFCFLCFVFCRFCFVFTVLLVGVFFWFWFFGFWFDCAFLFCFNGIEVRFRSNFFNRNPIRSFFFSFYEKNIFVLTVFWKIISYRVFLHDPVDNYIDFEAATYRESHTGP